MILRIKGFIYVKSKIYTIQIKMLLIANRFKDNNFKFDSKDVSYLTKNICITYKLFICVKRN